MIKAQELRVGNVIYQKCTSSIRLVTWYDIRNIELSETDAKYKVEASDIEPITLTPEILDKCRFKKFSNDWSFKGIVLHTRKTGFFINKKVPKMEYLHQLQNFVFTNRGEELQYQP